MMKNHDNGLTELVGGFFAKPLILARLIASFTAGMMPLLLLSSLFEEQSGPAAESWVPELILGGVTLVFVLLHLLSVRSASRLGEKRQLWLSGGQWLLLAWVAFAMGVAAGIYLVIVII